MFHQIFHQRTVYSLRNVNLDWLYRKYMYFGLVNLCKTWGKDYFNNYNFIFKADGIISEQTVCFNPQSIKRYDQELNICILYMVPKGSAKGQISIIKMAEWNRSICFQMLPVNIVTGYSQHINLQQRNDYLFKHKNLPHSQTLLWS